MLDFQGKKVELGSDVIILQIPVIGQHSFVTGTVVKLTDHKLHIMCLMRCKHTGKLESKKVARYPSQVILTDAPMGTLEV